MPSIGPHWPHRQGDSCWEASGPPRPRETSPLPQTLPPHRPPLPLSGASPPRFPQHLWPDEPFIYPRPRGELTHRLKKGQFRQSSGRASAVFSPPKTQSQPPIGDPPLLSFIERLPPSEQPLLPAAPSSPGAKGSGPVARGVGRQAAVFMGTYFSGERTMPGHPHLIRAS